MKKEKKQNFVLSSSRSVSVRDIGRFFIPRTTTLRGDEREIKAFTLIELLVVVLIIGILSAVALPQYQKAVMKTRYATMKNLVHSIYQAEQVYHLANNEYTTDFDKLDIDVGTYNNTHARTLPWGYCTLEPASMYCYHRLNNMSYYSTFQGARYCIIYNSTDTSSVKHRLCQQETGKSASDFVKQGDGGFYAYP